MQRYTWTAVGLHWLIAALIAAALGVGWVMTELAVSPLKLRMFNWHKWVGVSVLATAVVRLGWRLTHPPVPFAPMPAWQRRSAHGLHATLYVLLFLLPLSGWAYSNATGYPVVYLGLVRLPDLVARDKGLAQSLLNVHLSLVWLLASIVVVHVMAAIKHHFVDGDGTLERMSFRR